MVVDQDEEAVSRLFHALADTTRRDILRRSQDGELSVSALSRAYPISVAAVQKHVAVLESAGLVTKHRRGREQLVRAEADGVRRAHAALDLVEAAWRDRLQRIDDLIAPDPDPNQEPPHARDRRPA